MEIRSGFRDGEHPDIARQQSIHRPTQVIAGNRVSETERSHLRQRMYAGVGAARTIHVNRSTFHFSKNRLQSSLNGVETGLNLPTVVSGSVIADRNA